MVLPYLKSDFPFPLQHPASRLPGIDREAHSHLLESGGLAPPSPAARFPAEPPAKKSAGAPWGNARPAPAGPGRLSRGSRGRHGSPESGGAVILAELLRFSAVEVETPPVKDRVGGGERCTRLGPPWGRAGVPLNYSVSLELRPRRPPSLFPRGSLNTSPSAPPPPSESFQ